MNRSLNNVILFILLLKIWRGPSKQNINFGDYLQQLSMKATHFLFCRATLLSDHFHHPLYGVITFNNKIQISSLRNVLISIMIKSSADYIASTHVINCIKT